MTYAGWKSHPVTWFPVILGAAIVIAAVMAVSAHFNSSAASLEDAVIMTVNRQPLTFEAYQAEMQQASTSIYSYFEREYGALAGPDFWQDHYGGERPIDRLRQKAEEAIVRSRVQWGLAKKYGIVKDIGFLDRMRQEDNEDRLNKQQNGQVVFGVQQLRDRDYEDYALSKAVIELKPKLLEEGVLSLGAGELQTLYKQRKEVYKKRDTVEVEKIVITLADPKGLITDSSTQAAHQRMQQVLADADGGETFENITARLGGTGRLETQQFTDEYRRIDANAYPVLLEEAEKLSVGQVSAIIETGTELTLLKCVSRVPQGYQSFEEVEDQLKLLLTEAKYQTLVDELTRQAVVTRDENLIRQTGLAS